MLIEIDITVKSWKETPLDTDFTIHNLPFGIFSSARRSRRVGIAFGDEIIDLAALHSIGLLGDIELDKSVFYHPALNDFIACGKEATQAVRKRLQHLLITEDSPLRNHPSLFVQQTNATMHMPLQVGDYTDFYSSKEHATNVGKMFRDPEHALLPNWKHLPVGYHGRSSSIVVSGTDIIRPSGQIKPNDQPPIFGPSERMDFELEIAAVIGKESKIGSRISTDEADEYLFGLALFNDWSARDIQKWEYVPLGPFLGKNFASSISPWIVPIEAFEPFRVAGPKQTPAVLPYLQYSGLGNYDINLEVDLTTSDGAAETISHSNYKWMYWSLAQQLAHHTVNGCNVKVGDLMASGTISGPTPDSYGSMLELSWAGSQPIQLQNGQTRKFLQDHDEITLRGWSKKKDLRVGFGSVAGRILPAHP